MQLEPHTEDYDRFGYLLYKGVSKMKSITVKNLMHTFDITMEEAVDINDICHDSKTRHYQLPLLKLSNYIKHTSTTMDEFKKKPGSFFLHYQGDNHPTLILTENKEYLIQSPDDYMESQYKTFKLTLDPILVRAFHIDAVRSNALEQLVNTGISPDTSTIEEIHGDTP